MGSIQGSPNCGPADCPEVPIGLQVLYSYRRSPFPSTVYLCSIIFVSVSEIE